MNISNQTTVSDNIALNNLQGVPITKVYVAALVTQFCMGYEVLLRANAANAIKSGFFETTNPLTSGTMIGEVLGALFLGFAISNLVMAPFVDGIGLRRTHIISLLLYLVGILCLFAATPDSPWAWHLLWGGSLLSGFAWGSIEAVLNPLVVTLYPKAKVFRLNVFHAAYSVGVLLAAPSIMMVGAFSLGWKLQLALVFIPALIALVLIAQVKYPTTERVAAGISFGGMFKHTFARPMFYFFAFTMVMVAGSAFMVDNWIDLTLSKVIGMQGFWLVAFMYSTHLVVRFCAGILDRLLGSAGILCCGSLLIMTGLILLSQATSPGLAFFASLLFGMGSGVVWPTMLAGVAERVPKGGALAIGVVASAGMLGSYALMSIFGGLFDRAKITSAGGAAAFEALVEGTSAHDQVLIEAASSVFQTIAWLPPVGVLLFIALWFYERKRKQNLHRI